MPRHITIDVDLSGLPLALGIEILAVMLILVVLFWIWNLVEERRWERQLVRERKRADEIYSELFAPQRAWAISRWPDPREY